MRPKPGKGPGKDPPPGGAPTRPPSQRNQTSRNAAVNKISSAAPQLPQQNDTTRNAVVNKNPSAAPQLPTQNPLRNDASDTKGKAVDRSPAAASATVSGSRVPQQTSRNDGSLKPPPTLTQTSRNDGSSNQNLVLSLLSAMQQVRADL